MIPHRLPFLIATLTLLAAQRSPAQCVEGCTVIYSRAGEATGDQFGWSGRNFGDVTGDGLDDFFITAPTNDAGGSNAGRVYVYSGADGTELFRVTGEAANWNLGLGANPAGDVNSDGVPDFIAGAPARGAGRAIVYSGVDGAQLQRFEGQVPGDQFGFRVNGRGDVDRDRVPDLLISATFHDTAAANAGRTYLYSGATGDLLCTIDGEAAGDEFGTSLSFIGDINDDGRDEFVIGARFAGPNNTGRAYVYSYDGFACNLLRRIDPPPGAVQFGSFFAHGGRDVNNDGTPDFYVADFNANRAHVYSGATLDPIWLLTGDGNGGFGLGEMIPDVNGDHHDDLVLAAWVSNAGGSQAGKVFVYSGKDGSVLETFTHDIPGATFGFDAVGMRDINDDGRTDYLITAAWDLNQRGRIYAIAGTVDPGVPGDLNGDGCINLADLGILLADFGCTSGTCVGDVDGDGDTDLADLGILLSAFGSGPNCP